MDRHERSIYFACQSPLGVKVNLQAGIFLRVIFDIDTRSTATAAEVWSRHFRFTHLLIEYTPPSARCLHDGERILPEKETVPEIAS